MTIKFYKKLKNRKRFETERKKTFLKFLEIWILEKTRKLKNHTTPTKSSLSKLINTVFLNLLFFLILKIISKFIFQDFEYLKKIFFKLNYKIIIYYFYNFTKSLKIREKNLKKKKKKLF